MSGRILFRPPEFFQFSDDAKFRFNRAMQGQRGPHERIEVGTQTGGYNFKHRRVAGVGAGVERTFREQPKIMFLGRSNFARAFSPEKTAQKMRHQTHAASSAGAKAKVLEAEAAPVYKNVDPILKFPFLAARAR